MRDEASVEDDVLYLELNPPSRLHLDSIHSHHPSHLRTRLATLGDRGVPLSFDRSAASGRPGAEAS